MREERKKGTVYIARVTLMITSIYSLCLSPVFLLLQTTNFFEINRSELPFLLVWREVIRFNVADESSSRFTNLNNNNTTRLSLSICTLFLGKGYSDFWNWRGWCSRLRIRSLLVGSKPGVTFAGLEWDRRHSQRVVSRVCW